MIFHLWSRIKCTLALCRARTTTVLSAAACTGPIPPQLKILPSNYYEKVDVVVIPKIIPYNFQQWMSWLPQRWRTQRNAIRSANCNTSRIINILNAHCAVWEFLAACLSECQRYPTCLVYAMTDCEHWINSCSKSFWYCHAVKFCTGALVNY